MSAHRRRVAEARQVRRSVSDDIHLPRDLLLVEASDAILGTLQPIGGRGEQRHIQIEKSIAFCALK